MYLEYSADGRFCIATGALQLESTENIIDIQGNIWIEDSVDGGGSEFVREIDGKPLRRFMQEFKQSDEVPLGWRSPTVQKEGQTDDEGKLYGHCHCKGVEFWVSRAGEQSKNAESAYADLLVPYYLDKSDNPRNFPWWLPHPDRFLAGTCACTTCRRSSGFEITCWAFVPTSDITLKDGKPFQRTPYWGSMVTYESSPGVNRTFCGRCGCTIFWDGRDAGTLIDIAVGTLDAKEGARAEN